MSHAVVITRTTTSTNTSAVFINTGHYKTLPGTLQLTEVILGAICVGIVAYYTSNYRNVYQFPAELYFLMMTTTFLIASACMFLSCFLSPTTASIINTTLYEFIYHLVAFILYFPAALALIIDVTNNKGNYPYDLYLAASIIGLVNSVVYLVSAIFGYRSYKGL